MRGLAGRCVEHDQRIVDIPGLPNTRDLGGLPVRGGGKTRFGRVVRGPDADVLDQTGVEALIAGLGVTRDLDVRDDVSGRAGPGSLVASRVEDRHQISTYEVRDQAANLDQFKVPFKWDHSANYVRAISASPGISKILGLLADDSQRPTYIHCNQGKDRTGLVCGGGSRAI